MRTTRNTIPGVELRIDPLGLDRLRWLKSLFSAKGEQPSNSVIVRRALAFYLGHVEKLLNDDEAISLELTRLKAHAKADQSPWPSTPAFDGTPFTKLHRQAVREIHNVQFRKTMGFDLPRLGQGGN